MLTASQVNYLEWVDCIITLRRTDRLRVKPSAEFLDGTAGRFQAGWIISEENSDLYAGEWAMIPDRQTWETWPEGSPSWIASGDLTTVSSD